VLGQECDFDVVVKEDGFTYPGCARFDKNLTYDTADPEFPFKGTGGSIGYWFRPE
jgi:hypothetical protein